MTLPNEKAAPGKSGDLEDQLGGGSVSILRDRAGVAPRYSRYFGSVPFHNPVVPLPEDLPERSRRIAIAYAGIGVAYARQTGLFECDRAHVEDTILADLEREINEAVEATTSRPPEGSSPDYVAGFLHGVKAANESVALLQSEAWQVNQDNLKQTRGLSYAQLCDLRGEHDRAAKARRLEVERGL